MTRLRHAIVGAALVVAATIPLTQPAAASTGSDRLAGSTRVGTAVAISRRAFPSGSTAVYLARADNVSDALAAGALTDGPVLVVPSCDGVPQEVAAEITRLDPAEVFALGGTGAICDATLEAAAGDRSRDRLAGADRIATSAAIAEHAFPSGAIVVYVASATSAADAVAAGSLTDGPVLLVPATGAVPAAVSEAIATLDPTDVIALGGTAAVPASMLQAVADGRDASRIAGASRVETAIAISRHEFPDPIDGAVYLARSDVFADAIAAGGLTDGPVLLHPSCGDLSSAVATELARLHPNDVIALGGEGAVCSPVLAAAVATVDDAEPADCVYVADGATCVHDTEVPVVTDLAADDPELLAIVDGVRTGASQGLVGPDAVTIVAFDDRERLAEEYSERFGRTIEESRSDLANGEAVGGHGTIFFNTSLARERRGSNPSFLFKTALHEWFHVYQNFAAGDSFVLDDKAWLVEGAAEWFAWDVAARNGHADLSWYLGDVGVRHAIPNLVEAGLVLGDLESPEGFAGFQSSYEVAPFAIDRLMATSDIGAVLRDVWPAVGTGDTLSAIFPDVFGMTLTEFYADVDPHLRSMTVSGSEPTYRSS